MHNLIHIVRCWIHDNWNILINFAAMFGTTLLTSLLGFVYWWVAARYVPKAEFGFASAAISAMMLLSNLGMMGLGTLLIGELPRQSRSVAGSMIMTALLIGGVVSSVFGAGFALLSPYLSPDLAVLSNNLWNLLIFSSGVALTSVTMIIDHAVIGMLRGSLQLWRNAVFAAGKLCILVIAGILFATIDGMAIYQTWLLGNLLSMATLGIQVMYQGGKVFHKPDWQFTGRLKRSAMGHHALNLAIQVPSLVMPIVVTIILGAETNGSFYAAWMVANFVFTIPSHLATILYAVGSANIQALRTKLYLTMHISLLAGCVAIVGFWLFSRLIMSAFGSDYVEQASVALQIISLGVFPFIVKYHFVTILRLQDQTEKAVIVLAMAGVLEIGFSVIGAFTYGLVGLSIGWIIASYIETVYMLRPIFAIMTARSQQSTDVPESVPH
jgi:O-antigen/teichoic acid export membrane protein